MMDNSRRSVACVSLMPPEDDEYFELRHAPTAVPGPEAGLPDDGSQYYPLLNSFDLMEAQKAFTQLDALSYGRDADGRPLITMEGTREGRHVLIHVYDRPLESS